MRCDHENRIYRVRAGIHQLHRYRNALFAGACAVIDGLVEVDLWYVVGIGGVYYGTKIQAEAAARQAFPDEDESRRYARIYYKRFYQEV